MRVRYGSRILGVSFTNDGELEKDVQQQRGEAGETQTVLAILKSFIGSGILFMPGAIAQAGWAFSACSLIFIATLNAVCIGLLLDSVAHTGLTSFGDIGHRAAGRLGRELVHASLAVSQFASVICYLLFIAEVADACGVRQYVSTAQLLLAEVLVMAPLGLLRSVEQLELAILVADAGILFGLGVVLYLLAGVLSDGTDPAERGVVGVRPSGVGSFIGTALFTFEGLPLILPVRNGMREPERFWPIFARTFCGIVATFLVFGMGGYVAYGGATPPVLLTSLPSTPLVLAVRIVYIAALLLSSPLIFLPGARITELWAFGGATARNARRVNALRLTEYVCFGLVAVYARDSFQGFLGIVGVATGAPIAFIFPSYFWLQTAGKATRAASTRRVVARACICFGLVAMALVGYQTTETMLD